MELHTSEKIISGVHTYEVIRLVGQGTFGKVYEAVDQHNNKRVAIKRVEKSSNYISREVDILSQIKHKHCIQLLDVFYTVPEDQPEKKFQNMVFDFCNFTLSGYIKANRPSPTQAKRMFSQICSALRYLHLKRIAHRDLTPNNILVASDDEIKIADFGSAKTLEAQHVSMNYICSRFYRAPELLLGCTDYTTKIDIWSAGCILAELLTGKPLFPGVDTQDQMIKIVLVLGTPSLSDLYSMKKCSKPPKFPKIQPLYFGDLLPKDMPDVDAAAELLSGMLCYNPTNRFSIEEVVSHRYFTGSKSTASTIPYVSTLSPTSAAKLPMTREFMFDRVQSMKLSNIPSMSTIACGAGTADL